VTASGQQALGGVIIEKMNHFPTWNGHRAIASKSIPI
jgi:hypothetical protein